MEETKRIRLVFKEEDILSQAQVLSGLNRSWVLLKPETNTISELTDHVLRVFQLQQSCPHGLILSVSGFVLPSHESTHILKDSDIIRVRKKLVSLSIEGNAKTNKSELLQAGKNQFANTGVFLLANEGSEREKGGYESDEPKEEEDEEKLSKNLKSHKRKASEKLQNSSKKKKQHAEAFANIANSSDSDKDNSHSTKKKYVKNSEQRSVKDGASASGVKRAKHNGDTEDATDAPQELRKRPSRSARRKYAKRKWLREMAKIQKLNSTCESESLRNWKQDNAKGGGKNSNVELNGLERKRSNSQLKKWAKNAERTEDDGHPKGLLHWNQSPLDNFIKEKQHKKQKQSDEFQQQFYTNGDRFDQPNETHDDIDDNPSEKDLYHKEHENKDAGTSNQERDKEKVVPIVMKPGHIRFEPLDEEQAIRQNHDQSETIHWTGIISKKKGQKWGREDCFISRNDCEKSNKEYSETLSTNTENQPYEKIDFDKLPPLTWIPKEGDIIAYRIVELSSTWTPEISAYRIGRVCWYDTTVNQIMVVPVPEYPIVSKVGDEDEAMQLDMSLYKEDGSLEIDFPSLIDVRVFNNGSPSSGKSTEVCAGDEHNPRAMPISSNDNQTVATRSGNGGVNTWDQIIEALNSKKDELSKEKSSWEKSPQENHIKL